MSVVVIMLICILLNISCSTPAYTVHTVSEECRVSALSVALDHIGTKYVWGGQDIKTGVDCSGLIIEAYRMALISSGDSLLFQDTTAEELHRKYTLAIDACSSGDLLFMGENGIVSHVAFFLSETEHQISFVDAYSISGVVGVRVYDSNDPRFISCGRLLVEGGV